MTSTGLRDRAAELLPCPFCGAQPVVWNDGEDWIAACVGVATCHAEPGCVLNKTRDEAIRKWNTRAPRALLASPAPAGAEGWVFVPRDPSEEMIAARNACYKPQYQIKASWVRQDWDAMIAASPAPPSASPATPPAEARELVERVKALCDAQPYLNSELFVSQVLRAIGIDPWGKEPAPASAKTAEDR